MPITRRSFLMTSLLSFVRQKPFIMTTGGPVAPDKLGKTLIHEHFLVDFAGADNAGLHHWEPQKVAEKVLPYLMEIKKEGVQTIFDCTPDFLGRDVQLFRILAARSGIRVVTNTGYYGAVNNKYLPKWAFSDSAEDLAERWIREFEEGIDGTKIKPGFIKTSVDASDKGLSEIHRKLVRAAALTHLRTGLTICSHTGPASAAFEQLDILRDSGVRPDAFVWVHAQAEKDKTLHLKAARSGAWVSLDGIGWGDFDSYADSLARLRAEGLLHRVLISHDAGWYKPGEPEGGSFTGFTAIFKELMPRLKAKGFGEEDFRQLLVKNPAEAFIVRVRNL